jgi:hypothetical protein
MTTFADSHYPSVTSAARAWAETALPDVSVLGADEDASTVATNLEAFWWREAQKIGEGAPEDVGEDHWRAECRAALRARIDAYRVTLTRVETDEIERKAIAAAMREP